MHEISVTWAILVIYELIGRIQRLQRLKHKQMSELKMCVLIMPEDMLFYGEIWQKNYTAAGSDKSHLRIHHDNNHKYISQIFVNLQATQ